MGNNHIKELNKQVTDSEVQQAIIRLVQNDHLNAQSVSESLRVILASLKKEQLYFKHQNTYQVNETLIKVLFHPEYEGLIEKLLNLFNRQFSNSMNKTKDYLNKTKWDFLKKCSCFLLTFLNPEIIRFIGELPASNDVNQSIRNLCTQISKKQNPKIPNTFHNYDKKIDFFTNLCSNIYCVIVLDYGLANQYSDFLISSFAFSVQLYFDGGQKIIQSVENSFHQKLKTTVYMMGISLNNKLPKLFDLCILFLEALLINFKGILPQIQPMKFQKFAKMPVLNSPDLYHQMIVLIVSGISIGQQLPNVNTLRALRLAIGITQKAQTTGDHKLFYYLQQLCRKIKFMQFSRIYLYELIRKYTMKSELTTKTLESYKSLGLNDYQVKTDKGPSSYSMNSIHSFLDEQLDRNIEQFEKLSEQFIMVQIFEQKGRFSYDESYLWSRILENVKPKITSRKQQKTEEIE